MSTKLLTPAELVAYLARHGVSVTGFKGLPERGKAGRLSLYDPREILELMTTEPSEASNRRAALEEAFQILENMND
jgi:hypothetical protein